MDNDCSAEVSDVPVLFLHDNGYPTGQELPPPALSGLLFLQINILVESKDPALIRIAGHHAHSIVLQRTLECGAIVSQ